MLKIATVTIETDTTVENYGVFYAGVFQVEMPEDYDPSLVTATDIVFDPALRQIDPA